MHVKKNYERWEIKDFNYRYSHDLLEEDYCYLLPSHQRMTVGDILQIENLRKAKIRALHISGLLTKISDSYDKIE